MVNTVKDKIIKSCKCCGKGHNTGQCPAKHVECQMCSKVGHFANVCRSSNNNLSQDQKVQKLQRKQSTSISQVRSHHYPGQHTFTSRVKKVVLMLQIMAQLMMTLTM